MTSISKLLGLLHQHEDRYKNSIHFAPRETYMSPFSRLPFVIDAYGRYFFSKKKAANASFHGGRELGGLEEEILIPVLQEMTGAGYINVRPISGMNCLTVTLAALVEQGDTVLTLETDVGGHPSTPHIAKRLGINVEFMPMETPYDLNLEHLADQIQRTQPALIYIDQSNSLFPVKPAPIRELVDRYSPRTLIHFDSSHLNGLILGGAVFNPLSCGADTFGGSTHKTVPGPHKAFLATNNSKLAAKFDSMGNYFVSHSHMAEVISLAITLLEMKYCGGSTYASSVVENAQSFAHHLAEMGTTVAAPERNFTECHQVWVTPDTDNPRELVERLYRCGLIVNDFQTLPGISRHSFRLSLAEMTKLGMRKADVHSLAQTFQDALSPALPERKVRKQVSQIRQNFSQPHYCYTLEDIDSLPMEFVGLIEAMSPM